MALRKLGMLTPSSNTVVERVTPALLPVDGSVSAHVSRLRVVEITPDASSDAQFALRGFLDAAGLLADAKVDLILWNGTSASWLGIERDRELVAAIEAHTGTRATTATLAILAALARIGARRVGLVTPYVAEIEARIVANYGAAGIDIAAAVRSDLTENTTYAEIEPDAIAAMVRRVAPGVDAVLILCTNLAGATVADALTRELGIPVLDSVRVAVAHALAMLDRPPV